MRHQSQYRTAGNSFISFRPLSSLNTRFHSSSINEPPPGTLNVNDEDGTNGTDMHQNRERYNRRYSSVSSDFEDDNVNYSHVNNNVIDINNANQSVEPTESTSFVSYMIFQLKSKLKITTLFAICFYFIYLQIQSRRTSNWDTSRRVGFSQSNMCKSPGYNYGVGEFTAFSFKGVQIYNPFIFQDIGSSILLCFKDTGINECSSVLSLDAYESLQPEELTSMFKRDLSRSYFPFHFWIVSLSCVATILTVMYEKTSLSPSLVPESEGGFVNRNEQRVIVKLNLLICICIVGFLLASAQVFIMIFEEDCGLLYIGSTSASMTKSTSDFCSKLEGCGAAISSIINPPDIAVKIYRQIVFVMAIILSVALAFNGASTFQSSTDQRQVAVAPLNIDDLINQMNHLEIQRGGAQIIVRDSTDVIWIRRRGFDEDGRLEGGIPMTTSFLNQLEAIAMRNKMVQSWKFTHPLSSDDFEKECSICLCPLHVSDDTNHGIDALAFEASTTRLKPRPNSTSQHLSHNGDFNDENLHVIVPPSNSVVAVDVPGESNNANTQPDTESVVEVPCGHEFHRRCIVEWSLTAVSCPVCRASMEPRQ